MMQGHFSRPTILFLLSSSVKLSVAPGQYFKDVNLTELQIIRG